MKSRFATIVVLAAWGSLSGPTVRAAVVVLANRTEHEIRFRVLTAPDTAREYKLPPREVLPLPATGRIAIRFLAGGKPRQSRLESNRVYCFLASAGELELRQVSFTRNWFQPAEPGEEGEPAPAEVPAAKPTHVLVKLPVKLLVDQAEPYVRKVWEKRLRRRVAEASDILERHCRVRLEVADVGTWHSGDGRRSLLDMLGDFREKVPVKPGQLAIGFTGHRRSEDGERALGVSFGPLSTHILIREWTVRTEPEKLEVLLHEVGHILGACHSPERDSVMRPNLADGQAIRLAFRVGFDPINTLVMNLIAEELARRPVRSLEALSPATRDRLLDIFSTMVRMQPDDPAAPKYIRALGGEPPGSLRMRELPAGVANGARAVVAAVVSAAEQNERAPAREAAAPGERPRRTGDALTAYYFQTAAAAAQRLPADCIVPAYLLGLAIALDRSMLLRSLSLRGIAWDKIETEEERAHRLQVLGEPTMHGRHDLAQFFVVSAALPALVDGQDVSAAGIVGDLLQAQGGGTFRFDDLSMSLAGIAFGTQLDASPELLAEVAASFRVGDYSLAPDADSERLSRDEFAREYGSATDERFLSKQDEIRKRLLDLPGYQPRPQREK